MRIIDYINNFRKYQDLLKELVVRDIKVRYRRSVLGILWSVLNPLLTMTVMSFVFSTLFRNNLPNFPIYVLTGLMIFNFFSEATNQAMTSIVNNRQLILKVYIPKYIMPLSRITASLVNMLFSFIALILMLLILRTPPSITFILIPVAFAYVFIFCVGAGLFLSTLAVFFRDILHLYGIVLLCIMYFSAMFYPVEILPPLGQFLIRFNPLFHYIRYFRFAVYFQEWPNLVMNLYCISFSLIMLGLGLFVFYKNQYKFAERL